MGLGQFQSNVFLGNTEGLQTSVRCFSSFNDRDQAGMGKEALAFQSSPSPGE